MASETRHAAWQTERSYAVKLLSEEGPAADLAGGLPEFLDAFDIAFEWVNREDPAREGAAALAIFETRDGVTEEVWTYPPVHQGAVDDLVARLGFNPLTWTGRREFSSMVPRPSGQTPRSTAAPSLAPLQQRIIASELDAASIDSTEPATAPPAVPRSIRARVRAAWDDPLSRSCLLCSGGSLWFSVSFADANFLVLLGAALPALWWRQRGRGAVAAAAIDDEDWF